MSFPPRASPRGLLPPMPVQQKVSGGPLRGRVTWPCKCFGEDASPFCPAGLRSPETEVNSFLGLSGVHVAESPEAPLREYGRKLTPPLPWSVGFPHHSPLQGCFSLSHHPPAHLPGNKPLGASCLLRAPGSLGTVSSRSCHHLQAFSQFSSVTQSCPTLCDPMNRSTPGLPVHHQLPEFTQTHVHRVGDAIQPSHPVFSPSPPAPNPSQHKSLFQ